VPAAGSSFEPDPVQPDSEPEVELGSAFDDEDFVVTPAALTVHRLKRLQSIDPTPGKFITRVEEIATLPKTLKGERLADAVRLAEKLRVPLVGDRLAAGFLALDRLGAGMGEVADKELRLSEAKSALAKGGSIAVSYGVNAFQDAIRTFENVTWRPQLALASKAATMDALQREVSFALENDPDPLMLTADQYKEVVASGRRPASFIMQDRDIEELGQQAFEETYLDAQPIGDEVYGYVGDIMGVLLGRAANAGKTGDEALNQKDVENLIAELDEALVDPVEEGMVDFAYTGELPAWLDPTAPLRDAFTDASPLAQALSVAASTAFGSVVHPGIDGESEEARVRRWQYAMNEAIEQGSEGAKEFIGFIGTAIFDPTALIQAPGVLSRRLGTQLTRRGAGALDEALEATGDAVRAASEEEFTTLARLGQKELKKVDDQIKDVANDMALADDATRANLAVELEELQAARQGVLSQIPTRNNAAANGVKAQQQFGKDFVQLVDAAFRGEVQLRGDSRTLQAWSKWLDETIPDVPVGANPKSAEAVADMRALAFEDSERAFMDALRTANKEGKTLIGMNADGTARLSADVSKRMSGVTDAARLRVASRVMQWMSKYKPGREFIGSRSTPWSLERIRRTTSALTFGAHQAQPLAGPNSVGIWHAYQRGELMHPAAFAELVDDLRRNNRSTEVLADRRRAFIAGFLRNHPDKESRMKAHSLVMDGDQHRSLAAAAKMNDLSDLSVTTDGPSFVMEIAAAKGFMRGMRDLRDEVDEIAELLQSPTPGRHVEGVARMRAVSDAAQERAKDSAVKATLAQVARMAGDIADMDGIRDALDSSKLDEAFEALTALGDEMGFDSQRVFALAEDAALRARLRVQKALGDKSKSMERWDKYLVASEDVDALLIKHKIETEHVEKLKTERRAHSMNELRRRENLLLSTERRITASGDVGMLPDVRGELGAVRAMLKDADDALAKAKRDASRTAAEYARAADGLRRVKPKGDISEFVRDYAVDAHRAAKRNLDEANGLFARVRSMREFTDLTPRERASAVKMATAKRLPKKKAVDDKVRAAAEGLRGVLRTYARELHEHLVAQGVKGTSVDEVVANLDLDLLLPKLVRADGLSMQKALRGEPVRPTYLAPGMVDLQDVGVAAERRRLFAMAVKSAWDRSGGKGAPTDEFVEAFLERNGREIASLVTDPVPMLAQFLREADSALADRHFIADLRLRFPAGQRIAQQFGWEGDLHASAIGYARVDRGPLVGAHNKVSLPEELQPQHDMIISLLEQGKTAREVLEHEIIRDLSAQAKSKVYVYVKEAGAALEAPVYLPKPVAEYINWWYSDGGSMRDRLQKFIAGKGQGRTIFDKSVVGGAKAASATLDVFDAVHSWAKVMLTTFRSTAGYTFVNVVGNVTGGLQAAGSAALDPVAHTIGAMVASGVSPDFMIRLDGDLVTLRQIEQEMLEDGILSAAFTSAFRQEQGLVDPVSSAARDLRLFGGKQPVTASSPERGRVELAPGLEIEADAAKGGVWTTLASAMVESAPGSTDLWTGMLGKVTSSTRKADLAALAAKAAKQELPKALKRAAIGAAAGARVAGSTGAMIGAAAGAITPTRSAGAFAGSLLGTPFDAVGIGGVVGAIGAPGWVRITSEMNGWLETQARAAIYLGMRRKGASRAVATRTTDDALRNYSEITPLEREVMRRVFGFWTWDAGNLRLQAQWAAKNPGAYAYLATLLSIYNRGEFTESDLRQIPTFAQPSILLNMGHAKAMSVRGAPMFDAVQSAKKKFDLVAGGALLDEERAAAAGDLNVPWKIGAYFFNQNLGGRAAPDEVIWIGNKVGWTDDDARQIMPPYFLELMQIRPVKKRDGTGFVTDAPRRVAFFRDTPLNSLLGAYQRAMVPKEDPREVSAWSESMAERILAVMAGTYSMKLEKDPLEVYQRDLRRIERELDRFLPRDDRPVYRPQRFMAPASSLDDEAEDNYLGPPEVE